MKSTLLNTRAMALLASALVGACGGSDDGNKSNTNGVGVPGTGGAFGTGSRMPIKVTRALLSAALEGTLKTAQMRIDSHFGFEVPVAVPGIDDKILNPRETWADKAAYDRQAIKLVGMFRDNFKKFEAYVGPDVKAAAPKLAQAAE